MTQQDGETSGADHPGLTNGSSREGLKREIGITGMAANVVNLTIGAGIFVLPTLVYQKLGSSSVFAYLVCGALIAMVMICFSQIGKLWFTTGGIYNYVKSQFGAHAAFVTGNLYWMGFGLISDAAIANILLEMLSPFLSVLSNLAGKFVFFLTLFGILALINIRGVKHGVWLIKVLTLAKILPVCLLAISAVPKIDFSDFTVSTAFSFSELGDACIVLFFAFAGGEAALTPGGEIKNPRRTVPVGLLLGIFVSIAIYLAVQIISQGMLGDRLAQSEGPLIDVAVQLLGTAGTAFVVLIGVFSITGAISGDMLTMPRFLFAASKDKFLPSILSSVHPVNRTPHVSILIYAFLTFALSLSASFRQLAIFTTATILVTYFIVLLSFIRMRIKSLSTDPDKRLRYIGEIVFVVIVLCFIVWFLSHLKGYEILAIVIFFGLSSMLFYRTQLANLFKTVFILRKN